MMDKHRFDNFVEPADIGLHFEQIMAFTNRHVVPVFGLGVAGAAIGIALSLVVPKEWQASDVLQVGEVTQSTTTNGSESVVVTPIESPARTVERMSLPQFQDRVLDGLSLPRGRAQSHSTALIRDYANVRLVRDADLIGISARGFSPEEAKRIVSSYEEQIIAAHGQMLQPSMRRMTAELEAAKADVLAEEARRQQLDADAAKKSGGGDSFFSANVLLQNLRQKNDDNIRELSARVEELKENVSPSRTFNTRPLTNSIDVSERPVFPKKSTFGGLGVLIGLVLGVCVGLLRDRRDANHAP